MAMDEDQLRKTLDQLHGELEQNPKLALQERERLQHLARDIESLLEQSEATRAHYDSLAGRLEAAIAEFEVGHPALTNTLSKLLGILSNIGF
jgi:hypothetical protein